MVAKVYSFNVPDNIPPDYVAGTESDTVRLLQPMSARENDPPPDKHKVGHSLSSDTAPAKSLSEERNQDGYKVLFGSL